MRGIPEERGRAVGIDVGPRGEAARAWLEVDLAALRRNAARLAERVGGPGRLLPMVKADAYGLGAVPVAEALSRLGVWGFGVATAEEGAELRRAGIRERIVVFTPCAPVDGPRLLETELEPVVTSFGALRAYAAAAGGRPLAVHLEVDTGMGRFGLAASEAGSWAPALAGLLGTAPLRLASTFTHFHSAERDPEATRRQWALFREAVERLREAGVDPGLLHAANSAAALRHPETHADLVRPGLFLYGASPGPPRREGEGTGGDGEAGPLPAEPVARVRARVLDVRELPAGATVSYGATYTARRPSRLATLGIGYADGLPHALSNRGEALMGGRRVPIRGAVCMDMTVVDVTEMEGVRAGEAATLMGREGTEEIRLDELADRCGTIQYEILTGFSRRLPRVLVGAGAGEGPPDDAAEGGRGGSARARPGREGRGRAGAPPGEGHGLQREQPA